jgi:prepilin signal peptidase PulO-like enzyme (type II secretory pathway)
VPIVSAILNGWKCRECKVEISGRYTAIEITTATSLFAVVWSGNWDAGLFASSAFVLTLIPLIWIDWEFLMIPNGILIVGTIFTASAQYAFARTDLLSHLGSATAALLTMLAIRIIGSALLKKPALGMGDVKLSGFVTLQLGFTGFLAALWLGSIVALIHAALFADRTRVCSPLALGEGAIRFDGSPIPFGSFLGATSIVVLLAFDSLQSLVSTWLISMS